MYIVQTLGALHAGIKGLRYGARSEEKEREEERESKKVRGVGSGRVHAAARPGNECLTRDSEIFSFFFFFFRQTRRRAESSHPRSCGFCVSSFATKSLLLHSAAQLRSYVYICTWGEKEKTTFLPVGACETLESELLQQTLRRVAETRLGVGCTCVCTLTRREPRAKSQL